ncbi:iron zinc ion transporter [Chlorella sorokiniana]|uniref:Iron zinc ion transporter n=1 Tax=Chlorella sorokiniana TaxID=3076 RepID=A0A2P6U2J8_CHLSO|nr:iron zinc ion transporter [Chlorella sorokiniana]|eukprot:PRW60542.1 iron zinc ion transporter [Chlorella sorokiniana]
MHVFRRFWEGAAALGRREGVEAAAPTQIVAAACAADGHPPGSSLVTVERSDWSSLLAGLSYKPLQKDSQGGRALDGAVNIAGSRLFFGGVLTALSGWAIAGAVTKAPDIWQIVLQDVSSIQCYISDMILMRQQQTAFREQLRIIALLRSRADTVAQCFKAMLKQGLLEPQASGASLELYAGVEAAAHSMLDLGDALNLEPKDAADRIIIAIAALMGNIWMMIAFIAGMVTWLALGPKYKWSNNWQLWLNTSTALQQTLSVCLLTLARQRHNMYVESCMHSIFRQEAELEYRVRLLAGRAQPNPPVTVKSIAQDRFARGLDWYASLMGSGYGFALSAILFIVWIAIGDALSWSNNWWLIIGTSTGVIGTFNAAVLRFTLQQEERTLDKEYDRLGEEEQAVFHKLGLPGVHHMHQAKQTLMARISLAVSRACATRAAVLASLLLIAGLLIGATVVLWSETAQLLVNSTTMILESFLLIVLIDAHNIEATGHRMRLHGILIRRLQLLVIVKRLRRCCPAAEGDLEGSLPSDDDKTRKSLSTSTASFQALLALEVEA